MDIQPKHLIPMVILVLVLAGGVYWWQRDHSQQEQQASITTNQSDEGIVLGESNADIGTNVSTDIITDGQTYVAKFGEIKKPVNDAFTDLSDKMKYANLFPSEEIIKFSQEIDQKIDQAIKTLNELKIADKFKPANQKYLESLNLLKESLSSLRKSYDANNKNAKADREDYAYKIDQSNNVLKDIQVPN